MDQRITTDQLVYKIGALTLENDILRAQVEKLQEKIAELTANELKVAPRTTSISD
jgi:cell division protein FtsB